MAVKTLVTEGNWTADLYGLIRTSEDGDIILVKSMEQKKYAEGVVQRDHKKIKVFRSVDYREGQL